MRIRKTVTILIILILGLMLPAQAVFAGTGVSTKTAVSKPGTIWRTAPYTAGNKPGTKVYANTATANNGKTSGSSGGSWLGVRAVTGASVPQGSKPDVVTSVNDAKPNSFLANKMTKSEQKSVFTAFVDRIKSGMAYAWAFVRDWITGLFG